MSDAKTIRIGNGQGFWGDNVDAPVELLRGGPIDYIGMDYLAEVTLSIMMRQKLKNPDARLRHRLHRLRPPGAAGAAERGVRVLTNAGGLNPRACRERIFEVARELGVSGLAGRRGRGRRRAAAPAGAGRRRPRARQHGHRRADRAAARQVHQRQRLPRRPAGGRGPRARVRTSSSAAGSPTPPWRSPRRSTSTAGRRTTGTGSPPAPSPATSSSAAPQCTGGNFSRWWEVPDLWNVGYPIVEMDADGDFVVTKHPGTGGMVTVDTVSEQLALRDGRPERVHHAGRGRRLHLHPARAGGRGPRAGARHQGPARTRRSSRSPPPTSPATRRAGRSPSPARGRSRRPRLAAETVWKRLERAGVTFDDDGQKRPSCWVRAQCCRASGRRTEEPPEVVLRLAVRDADRAKVERFGKEIAPLVTAGPPGVTGFAGGRPEAAGGRRLLAGAARPRGGRGTARGHGRGGMRHAVGPGRAWRRSWSPLLLLLLLLGFFASALANRLVFAGWGLAMTAAVTSGAAPRLRGPARSAGRSPPAWRRALARWALAVLAWLVRRHRESLDLGLRAVLGGDPGPPRRRPRPYLALAGLAALASR